MLQEIQLLWWYWAIFGLVLMVLEMITPVGGIIMMFGFSALGVGVVTALGMNIFWVQVLLFAFFSLGCWFFVKKKMDELPQDEEIRDNTLVGEEAELVAAIKPGEKGQVEVRGALWKAKNTGGSLLQKGEVCKIVGQKSLLLEIEKGEE